MTMGLFTSHIMVLNIKMTQIFAVVPKGKVGRGACRHGSR